MVEDAEGVRATAVGAAPTGGEAGAAGARWEARWVGREEGLVLVEVMAVAAAGAAATAEAAMGLVVVEVPWALRELSYPR